MKKAGFLLVSLIMCSVLSTVNSYADEVIQKPQISEGAEVDNNALVELYYSELNKQLDKELLNEASAESSQLAEYYEALAMQDITMSNVYSQLAEYYKAVANTNCICMVNGTYEATGVCTCGKNANLNNNASNNKKTNKSTKNSKSSKNRAKTYAYDSYGYLVDGSTFVIKGKVYIKSGKYFVDLDGYHYSIDEDDIVYGIERIEKETGRAYRIEAIEKTNSKHNQALRDTKDYDLWVQLKNSK